MFFTWFVGKYACLWHFLDVKHLLATIQTHEYFTKTRSKPTNYTVYSEHKDSGRRKKNPPKKEITAKQTPEQLHPYGIIILFSFPKCMNG